MKTLLGSSSSSTMFLVATAFLVSAVSALDSVNSEVTITEAVRNIDLTSQLVKETLQLTVANGGSGAVRTLHFAVPKEVADKVVYVGATVSCPSCLASCNTLEHQTLFAFFQNSD